MTTRLLSEERNVTIPGQKVTLVTQKLQKDFVLHQITVSVPCSPSLHVKVKYDFVHQKNKNVHMC